jgi:hypothetical protein
MDAQSQRGEMTACEVSADLVMEINQIYRKYSVRESDWYRILFHFQFLKKTSYFIRKQNLGPIRESIEFSNFQRRISFDKLLQDVSPSEISKKNNGYFLFR